MFAGLQEPLENNVNKLLTRARKQLEMLSEEHDAKSIVDFGVTPVAHSA
jgi:hypothetical protein